MVERQQSRQSIVLGNVGGPAIGVSHGFVQGAVRVGEPSEPLIVEIREGALGQLLRAIVIAWLNAGIADGADAARVRPDNEARPWTVD